VDDDSVVIETKGESMEHLFFFDAKPEEIRRKWARLSFQARRLIVLLDEISAGGRKEEIELVDGECEALSHLTSEEIDDAVIELERCDLLRYVSEASEAVH
jgi:hypothetical protein